jgi:hypothetical protein
VVSLGSLWRIKDHQVLIHILGILIIITIIII